MDRDRTAQLRKELHTKLGEVDKLLHPAFELAPVLPGVVTVSKHRCGNEGCTCTREGKLHEAVRVLIRFRDGYATRSVSKDELPSFKSRTDAYRRLRKARRTLGKWQKEVVRLLDAIERERRSLDGLSEEDRKRPLR